MPKRVYDRAYASVRFMGERLDPLAVTLALRLPADHMHRDGEPHLQRTKTGRVTEYASFHGGMWSMSSRKWVQSPRLAVHLDWLLRELEPEGRRCQVVAGRWSRSRLLLLLVRFHEDTTIVAARDS